MPDQQLNIRIVKYIGHKAEFAGDKVTIVTGRFSYYKGKHYMAEPRSAKAWFECDGQRYRFRNEEQIATVEDWYWKKLLPKMQMINLMRSNIPA